MKTMLTSSVKAKREKIDHFHIDIVVREVMNRQLSVSVAKMKLCCLDRFLSVTVLFMLIVSSQSSLRNEQATQEYWMQQGEEEIKSALNLEKNNGVAKNIIIFVADGMGPNTLTASRIYNGGESGHLVFEKFPNVGILKTYAVDKTIPDSACTATALFSGIKTNWEVAGFDAGVPVKDCEASLNPARKVSTIVKWAQDAGKDTGFVTTTRVTHATPAALFSHIAHRKWECEAVMPLSASRCKDIARQLIEDEPGRNIKVIMGGGLQCLTWNITNKPSDPIDTWSCKRADGRDLIQTWKEDKEKRNATYNFLRKTKDLQDLDYGKTDYVLGVFANGHLAFEDQRDKTTEGMPSIKEMTAAAINVLKKNKNGYMLMVEGGMIDQAHHRGYARRALEETVQLNKAIEEAIKMTGDDTLIIVTSDHAHGLQINGYTQGRNDILGVAMNSRVDGVPYTALTYGTGAASNYQYRVNGKGEVERRDPSTSDTRAYDYTPQTGILNDEVMHGGSDVAVFAKGPMAHLLHGVHEQSYVAYVMAYSARIGRYSNRPLINNKASSTHTSLSLLVLLLICASV